MPIVHGRGRNDHSIAGFLQGDLRRRHGLTIKDAETPWDMEPRVTSEKLKLEMRGTDRYIEHYRHQLGLDPGEQAS